MRRGTEIHVAGHTIKVASHIGCNSIEQIVHTCDAVDNTRFGVNSINVGETVRWSLHILVELDAIDGLRYGVVGHVGEK